MFCKAGLVLGAVMLGTSVTTHAIVRYNLADFETPGSKANIGPVWLSLKGDDNAQHLIPYFKLGVSPDLKLGPVGLGFDANYYLPLADQPAGVKAPDSVAFRMLSYDHFDQAGIKWGRLTNETFGYGMLMDRYDSGNFGNDEFTTEKAGFRVYEKLTNPVRVDAMYTASKVLAARVTYQVADKVLFDKPLYLGATYVSDDDGVFETSASLPTIGKGKNSGWGVDVGVPLADDLLKMYAEYATLGDTKGAGAGFRGAVGSGFEYKLEYRMLGSGFVPGYYNMNYEDYAQPTNIPAESFKGLLGYIGMNFMDGFVKSEFEYTAYENQDPTISGALGFKRITNYAGVLNYNKDPFNNSSVGTLEATIKMYDQTIPTPIGSVPGDIIVNHKRWYGSSFDKIERETTSFSYQPNLKKMFPGFDFLM